MNIEIKNNILKLIHYNFIPSDIDILIYSSGKAGGTTLFSTFNNNGYSCLYTHHIHSLKYNIQQRDDYKKEYDIYFNNLNINDLICFYSLNKKVFYVIDTYRNLLERNISEFFQNIVYFFNLNNPIVYKIEDILKLDISILITCFENIYIKNTMIHSETLEEHTRILENNTIFDHNKKYIMCENNNVKYIKIRFNDIKNCNRILSTILEKEIIMFSENLSELKSYNMMYKLFLDKYKIDKNVFYNKYINDKYFQYYNNEEEKIEYNKKWQSKFKE